MSKASLILSLFLISPLRFCRAEEQWSGPLAMLADYAKRCSELKAELCRKHPKYPKRLDELTDAEKQSLIDDYLEFRAQVAKWSEEYPQPVKFIQEVAEAKRAERPFVFQMLWYVAPYSRSQQVMSLWSDGRASITRKDRRGKHGSFFAALDKEKLANVRARLGALRLVQKSPLPKVEPGHLHIGFAYMRGDDFTMVTFVDHVPDALKEVIDIVVAELPNVSPRSAVAPWFWRPQATRNANKRPAGNAGR